MESIETLDDLLKACVAALNETGLGPDKAVAMPTRVLVDGELYSVDAIRWDDGSHTFIIVVE
jgi:hypothetical protein